MAIKGSVGLTSVVPRVKRQCTHGEKSTISLNIPNIILISLMSKPFSAIIRLWELSPEFGRMGPCPASGLLRPFPAFRPLGCVPWVASLGVRPSGCGLGVPTPRPLSPHTGRSLSVRKPVLPRRSCFRENRLNPPDDPSLFWWLLYLIRSACSGQFKNRTNSSLANPNAPFLSCLPVSEKRERL